MKRHEPCIFATVCLPWDEAYRFEEEIFRRLVRTLASEATKHIYIFGSAGEGYAVTEEEFKRIAEVFVEEMRACDAFPMIGLTSPATETVLQRARWAYDELGIRDFQISLPFWTEVTWPEALGFFDAVCGRFEDCRFMHYNCSHVRRLVTAEEYAEIEARYPNIVATKNLTQSIRDAVEIVRLSPSIQHHFMEYAFGVLSLLGLEAGWVVAPASANWETAQSFFRACRNHDRETIATYLLELIDIQETILRTVGDEGHMDGTYDKLYAKMAVPDFPLRMRPPYGGASGETFRRFVQYISDTHPHWLATDANGR